MASLTPLSKGLIGLVVLGGMASAVWHLYLKERIGTPAGQPPAAVSAPMSQDAPAAINPPAGAVSPVPVAPAQTPPATKQPATKTGQAMNLSADENFEAGRKLVASGDYAQARSHLEQALEQGNAGAACLLGDMTIKGQGGIAPSQDKAAKLFQLAQSRNTICFSAGQ
jgi:TPR repeat protein